MTKRPESIQKEKLIKKYLKEGKSYNFIIAKLDVSPTRISRAKYKMKFEKKAKTKSGGSAGAQPPA